MTEGHQRVEGCSVLNPEPNLTEVLEFTVSMFLRTIKNAITCTKVKMKTNNINKFYFKILANTVIVYQ